MDELDFFYNSTPPESKPPKGWLVNARLKLSKRFKKYYQGLPHVLTKKERYLILICVFVFIGGVISIPITAYHHFTKAVPDYGGTYQEGVVGEPRFINPILQISDVDRDLSALIYSGLTKTDGGGNIIPDLASHYELSNDGLSYTFFLKKNAKWHDGKPFSSDDVAFTIRLIQNSEYNSAQRVNWQGVEVTKVDNNIVRFTLKNKYAQFLVNTTVGILPAHLWENIKPINFARSELNLKPAGNGPYKFAKFKKDSLGRILEYEFDAFKDYHNSEPFIQKIIIKLYTSEDQLIDAYLKGSVDGLGFVSSRGLKKIRFQSRLNINKISLPRYFAIFFNQAKNKLLADKNIRLALAHATDKGKIVESVLGQEALIVDSPMLPEILGINPSIKKYDFNPDFAKQILENTGWKDSGGDGIREKEKKDSKGKVTGKDTLELTLVTSSWSELVDVASILKKQWGQIGVKLNIQTASAIELQQMIIKDRDYEMILFGEVLTLDPDPFSFWHSSQKREPGLNLALYDNKNADKLLEEARQTLDPDARKIKYDNFQKILTEDLPTIFLYSPDYIYPISKKVYGVNLKLIGIPSERFSNINKWYIKTQRAFK